LFEETSKGKVLGGDQGIMLQREQKLSAKKEKELQKIDKKIEKIEETNPDKGEV
jgi:hypothetical protein